ncbi:partner of Y14 and mago-like protein [Dinothrombium tinctorium]|uniref:Partner of Y14 and mago n=1 Tax=Dinothrombium tinctorium TaxID=1965070 RepID=A0A3S3PD03_9ACAR|nr:partner of Y14 and mago-like protein [Dinothrombium tinctorium]
MATQYVKDDVGTTFIAASQRPDGTWRKQRKVKDGFVPQEEVPLYESKGKKLLKDAANALPAGLTPEIWEKMKSQQKEIVKVNTSSKSQRTNSSPLTTQLSTGLTVEDNEWKTVSNSKKKKKKSESVSSNENSLKSAQNAPLKNTNTENVKLVNEAGQPLATDPVKRLRNLRKKLKEIEALKTKPRETLEKEQLEKINRMEEVMQMIEELQLQVES